MYNGLGVNPTTGYVYANTLKGVGPFYTTNQLWVFDFAGSTGTPLFKFETIPASRQASSLYHAQYRFVHSVFYDSIHKETKRYWHLTSSPPGGR